MTDPVSAAIAAAAARFAPGETARLDAELLMAHALGLSREALLLNGMEGRVPDGFAALVERRLACEPVAYITASRGFWTIDLEVGPGVLVPRPESELLIETALAQFGEPGPERILDLGTGPGTLLLAALVHWPNARGLGIDRSSGALAFARRNAARLGLAERARFERGDWAAGISERFDLVLSNPPYVADAAPLPAEVADWEPPGALYAGPDGLDAMRILAAQVPSVLAPGGIACVEIGAGQRDAATALFATAGFSVRARVDLAGIPRCLALRV